MARYDGLAEWFDERFAASPTTTHAYRTALRLLGDGPGRLLEIGCGGGTQLSAFAEAGWSVVGVDVSADQLRLARERGHDVEQADAARLPFADGSFDAAFSVFTHTDLDDFPAAMREAARVLRAGAPLVYVGVHPCFIGPHSRYTEDDVLPAFYPGYRDTSRYAESPGTTPDGIRERVGAAHLPLG